MIREIDRLGQSIPQVKPFISKIDRDIRQGEAAAKSGNRNAALESLAAGAKDAKAIGAAVKSNPKISKLDHEAPAIINKISAQIKQGTKAPKHINNVATYFDGKLGTAA